jgi:hypothetical protein
MEKIPKQISPKEQVKNLKRSALRTGAIFLMCIGSNMLPIKETKTAIFDPLLHSPTIASQHENTNVVINRAASRELKTEKQRKDFAKSVKEFESLSETKIEFPENMVVNGLILNRKKELQYNQLLRSTTEIAIFNQFLPTNLKIKKIRFVESIEDAKNLPGTISASIVGDVIYITDSSSSGTAIHEMAHIISKGLEIDRDNASMDGYNQLLDYLQGENKNMSPKQLLDHGFRDYSFDSSRVEIYTTVAEMLGGQSYNTLNSTQKEQSDKVLAFAATKQSVFGTEEFKKLIIDYGKAIHDSDFKTIDTKIKQNIHTLKAKVDQHQKLKTDPNVQKYIHQLELMKLKVNTLNGVKIYLPVFLFLVLVISTLETTLKTANTIDAHEKML